MKHRAAETAPAAATIAEPALWLWTLPGGGRSRLAAPDAGEDASLVDVRFAGFLFDRDAAARDLSVAAGADERAVVAAAYARWGMGLFEHLRGSFAVAIADPARRLTIVARDHVGLQPVFYAVHDGGVSVAASPRALVGLNGVSSRLNRVALADALCRRYPDSDETFFEAVRRVPPGSFLQVGSGSVVTTRYWDPLARSAVPVPSTEEEALEQFAKLQSRAVRRCLRVGPSAIFLSGGLDSVSVAATAVDQTSTPDALPIALSLTFPGASCDEHERQTAVATRLNLPQCLVAFEDAVGAEALLSQGLRLNRHLSSPLFNYWRPAYMELARRGRQLGAATVLTGEGGDEWMAASPYVAADLLARGRLLALRRFLHAWGRSEPARGILRHRAVRPLAGRMVAILAPEAWERSRTQRFVESDPTWVAPAPEIRRAQLERAARALGPARPPRGFAAAELERNLWGAISQREKDEWFVLGQLIGMRFLHPYHDADLVAFFCRLPVECSNAGGWLKGLTRRQLAARFPGLGFEHQRKVMASEFQRSVMRRGWESLASHDLGLPVLEELGVVDADGVRADLLRGDPLTARRAWELVNTEAWAREQTRH